MFDQAFISKLGTKSLSHDSALTQERVNAAWNKASKKQQDEVLRLAGVKYAIAYRVRKLGTITTKMTIAYSQALNLDPYYLIGAVSENAGYTYDSAKKLLIEIKCGKLVKEYEKTHTPPKADPVPAENSFEEASPESEPVKELSPQAAIQKLSEEDMITLFRGLIIKAGTGKPQAIADMTKITEILLG
jgi:hypothetical protein